MPNTFQFSEAHHNFFTKHGQKVEYRKKQLLMWSADATSWVYYVESGLVKVSCFYDNGSESTLGHFIAGQTFAQIGSFFNHTSGADLEYMATEPCTIYRVTREQFFEQLTSDQAFNRDYMTMLLRNQLILVERVVYLGESVLTKRCVRWLLLMAKYYGERDGKSCYITVPLTQDTIASFLNITRESTGKCLRSLIQTGHVQMEKKHITITDVHKLQSLI